MKSAGVWVAAYCSWVQGGEGFAYWLLVGNKGISPLYKHSVIQSLYSP